MGSMKVHLLSRGLSSWDNNNNNNTSSNHHHDQCQTSLTLSCNGLHSQAHVSSPPSSSSSSATSASAFDLKTFLLPDTGFRKTGTDNDLKRDPPQVETHPGGTRWNPTQEQIGILEMLYRGGMRTPNAQQIEHITAQLGRYGKIEGKNVFYWFQNHKARERQKQKRNSNCQSPNPVPNMTATTMLSSLDNRRELIMVGNELEDSPYKRTCRSWGFENLEMESETNPCNRNKNNNHKNNNLFKNVITLELFPLHPELGKS